MKPGYHSFQLINTLHFNIFDNQSFIHSQKMKQLILSMLFLLGVCSLTRGQNVYPNPLPPDSSTWLINIQGQPYPYGPCNSNGYCGSQRFRMMGDTILGGILYQKVYETSGFGYTYNQSTLVFVGDSANHYMAAVRQDLSTKKVFLRSPAMLKDTLLYDFNLQTGDTLPPSYINNSVQNGKFYVTSIDSILVGSVFYKRFKLGNPMTNTASPFMPSLIEGIGSTDGFLEQLYIFFEQGPGLVCFNKNDGGNVFGGYPPGECTAYFSPTGITENFNPIYSYSVAPNPSEGLFTIHAENALQSAPYTIYNAVGQIIYRNLIPGMEFTIDLKSEPKGIYFLNINAKKQNLNTKLFIK